MEPILDWVARYGDAGLFSLLVLGIVGLPVPDETLLVFSGYLISKGQLQLLPTVLSAFAGTTCGISLSYLAGAKLGVPVIQRYGRYLHVTPERLERVHRWFERIGNWLLPAGYFIPGVRHFTALVAGTSGLRYPTFAVFAYPGGAVWVTVFIGIGYFVGERWRSVLAVIHRYLVGSVVLVVLLGCVVFVIARWSRKKA